MQLESVKKRIENIEKYIFFKDNPQSINYPYGLRNYQQRIYKAYEDGYKNFVVCLPRQTGKDLLAFRFILDACCKKAGIYYYLAPTLKMLKNIIWLSGATVENVFYRYIELIPKYLIKSINNHEMFVQFRNGSVLRFLNTSDITKLRGMTPTGVVVSEYAFHKSDVLNIINPAILNNNAWVMVNSTPISVYDHFWKLLTQAEKHWYVMHENVETLLDKNNSRWVSELIVQRAIADGMSASLVASEYMTHPIPDVDKTIFGLEMANDIEIKSDLYNARLPLHVAMDLGLRDYTSILLFQFDENKKIRIISEYESNNQPVQHYVNKIRSLCKNRRMGTVFLPHDGAKRDPLSPSLQTFVDFYDEQGFNTYKLDRPKSLEAAILLAKSYCGNISIDDSCEKLIMGLSEWSRDDKRIPKHDNFSHISMAFIYLTMGIYYDLDFDNNVTIRQYAA